MGDVKLDVPLMQHLEKSKLPEDKADALRVRRAAEFLRLDERGKLWAKHPTTQVEQYVPSICERKGLVSSALKALGYPNEQQLAALLRTQVFWEGLQCDCIAINRACCPCQIEGTRFPQPS